MEKIGRVMLEGRVSATDIDKTTATVNVRQMLNGKWEQTYTTQTDEQGVFKVEVYDDETDVTISGDGYLDAMLHRDAFGGSGNVGVIPVNLLSGFAITANIIMQKAVAIGDAREVTAWTEGLNNIDFALTNMTNNAAIADFTVQNGSVIIKTGASVGDNISLTAKSKQGVFADATTTFTIAEGANALDLQLTELGGIDATCATTNNGGTTGFLYDNSNGKLVAKGSYTGETMSLRHLPSGIYTLVSMGRSLLLGNLTNLSDLSSVGLSEGTDYVKIEVEVTDGTLSAVNVNEVPKLDETRFYYTSDEIYFNANNAFVTAGNYLTLQAHVDFKPEYADKVDDVTLTIDLPAGCQMVGNSVIANRQTVPHTINGNRVTMTLSKKQYEGQVRFCVIPTLNQVYTITPMASFDINGQITQPIGTAQFEAKGLSLSVPGYVAKTNITINGTAKGHSEVSIYDNDVLIGKTSSKADGSWTAECELFKPYSHSFHDIYAKITTEDSMELTSETRMVEYDKNGNVPEKVQMTFYNDWMKKNIDVEFNLVEGTTTPSSYPFYHGTDFTFLADFTRNDSTEIKDVNIKVLNSDGTVRTLPATFDGKQNKWVATTKYESSNRLPQNVMVEYESLSGDSIDNTDSFNDQMAILSNGLSAIMQYSEDNYDYSITEEDENFVCMDVKENGETIYTTKIEVLEFATAVNKMSEVQFDFDFDETGKLQCSYTEVSKAFTSTTFIDFADSVAYIITLKAEGYTNYANRRRKALSSISWVAKTADNLQNFGGIIDHVFPYVDIPSDLDFMYDLYKSYRWNLDDIHLRTQDLLHVRCSDGSFKLSDGDKKAFSQELSIRKEQGEAFTNQLYNYIREYERRIAYSAAYDLALTAAGMKAGSLLLKCMKFTPRTKVVSCLTRRLTRPYKKVMPGDNQKTVNMISNVLGVYLGNIIDVADQVFNPKFADFRSVYRNVSSWAPMQYNSLMNNYFALSDDIEHNYKNCDKEEEDEDEPRDEKSDNKDDFKGKGTTPEIDPSGYVYEAVFSNRLEGVTATCYQKVIGEDMYGDPTEEAVVWNASDYSQVNPQLTDKTGFYRWDVPQGWWQVKYEKEGYETTYSDWLPVPPPQLDVNIGMKQSTPPTVTQMRGYESGITIDLSKYMRPETMTTDNITVTRNGSNEKGSVELLNAEKAPLGDETFVSKVKFVPENYFSASDIVVVTVHKEVESYCGVKMTADHVETVKIEPEVKSIVVDKELTVAYQGERELRVLVLPKEASVGKTLQVKTSSEMIASVSASEVTIDQDGAAKLTLSGELPGGAVLDFAVDGTDVTATSKVKVVINNQMVAVPTANISNGMAVYRGTLLTLTCATEGATIYYTTDGTCPCDENGTRQLYTEPLTINEDMTIQMMAEDSEGDVSDVVTLTYSILQSKDGVALNDGWNWVSFNMKNDEALGSTNTALASGTWTASDIIKDNQYVDMYSAAQHKWIGTMSNHGKLTNAGMYKIHSSKKQTLSLIGEAVHPAKTSISIGVGWNYISYVPLVSMSVIDALSGYEAQNGDVIKSQDAFATYSTTNGWEGDLTTLDVGKGYMLKRNTSGQTSFCYPIPNTSITPSYAKKENKTHPYADNMNVVGEIYGITVEDGDSLIAYVGGEVRGVCRLENNKKVFLTIHGDREATVALVLQRDGEIIATANDMIGYRSNEVVGTGDTPAAITFSFEGMNTGNAIGNIKAIYSMNGMKMGTKKLNNIPAGAYIIYSEMGGNTHITKLIKQ